MSIFVLLTDFAMFLKKIVIDNFACFRHFSSEFSSGVNVIIGKNGAGKSSLIKALSYLMNFMFTTDRSMGNDFLAAGNPDLKMNSMKHSEFYRFRENDTAVSDANLHGEMLFDDNEIVWDMYKKSTFGASLYPSKYLRAYQQIMQTARERGKLPLLACISDSFPHRQTNISSFAKNEINNTEGILRNFGYYQWDNETACTTIWQMRLLSVMAKSLSLRDPSHPVTKEVDYIVDTLKRFSHPINAETDDDFEITKVFFTFQDGEKPQLWLQLKSGQELAFDNLPAGYRRLYSIVLDLAYRSYLINRDNPQEAIGLVLIDEIDLHLHPSLQIEILERFRSVFPRIQFIMTTHSPLVISNLRHDEGRNTVLRLVYGENFPHVMPDLYGIDYNAALFDGLGVEPNNEELDFLKNSLRRAIARSDTRVVNAKKEQLRHLLSEERYARIISEIGGK